MASGPQTVRVYMCAAYRDMQAERAYLHAQTFPRLGELFAERGFRLEIIDPCQNASEKEAEGLDSLPRSLRDINRCWPFFLGFVGTRDNQIVDQIPLEMGRQYPELRDYARCSRLQLEILHGVLRNKKAPWASFFYLREESFLTSVPEEEKPLVFPQDRMEAHRLGAFRRAVRNSRRPFFEYDCRWDKKHKNLSISTKLGQQVTADLLGALSALMNRKKAPARRVPLKAMAGAPVQSAARPAAARPSATPATQPSIVLPDLPVGLAPVTQPSIDLGTLPSIELPNMPGDKPVTQPSINLSSPARQQAKPASAAPQAKQPAPPAPKPRPAAPAAKPASRGKTPPPAPAKPVAPSAQTPPPSNGPPRAAAKPAPAPPRATTPPPAKPASAVKPPTPPPAAAKTPPKQAASSPPSTPIAPKPKSAPSVNIPPPPAPKKPASEVIAPKPQQPAAASMPIAPKPTSAPSVNIPPAPAPKKPASEVIAPKPQQPAAASTPIAPKPKSVPSVNIPQAPAPKKPASEVIAPKPQQPAAASTPIAPKPQSTPSVNVPQAPAPKKPASEVIAPKPQLPAAASTPIAPKPQSAPSVNIPPPPAAAAHVGKPASVPIDPKPRHAPPISKPIAPKPQATPGAPPVAAARAPTEVVAPRPTQTEPTVAQPPKPKSEPIVEVPAQPPAAAAQKPPEKPASVLIAPKPRHQPSVSQPIAPKPRNVAPAPPPAAAARAPAESTEPPKPIAPLLPGGETTAPSAKPIAPAASRPVLTPLPDAGYVPPPPAALAPMRPLASPLVPDEQLPPAASPRPTAVDQPAAAPLFLDAPAPPPTPPAEAPPPAAAPLLFDNNHQVDTVQARQTEAAFPSLPTPPVPSTPLPPPALPAPPPTAADSDSVLVRRPGPRIPLDDDEEDDDNIEAAPPAQNFVFQPGPGLPDFLPPPRREREEGEPEEFVSFDEPYLGPRIEIGESQIHSRPEPAPESVIFDLSEFESEESRVDYKGIPTMPGDEPLFGADENVRDAAPTQFEMNFSDDLAAYQQPPGDPIDYAAEDAEGVEYAAEEPGPEAEQAADWVPSAPGTYDQPIENVEDDYAYADEDDGSGSVYDQPLEYFEQQETEPQPEAVHAADEAEADNEDDVVPLAGQYNEAYAYETQLGVGETPEEVEQAASRRTSQRLNSTLEAICETIGRVEMRWNATVEDVSRGGLKIVTERRFEAGTILSIELPSKAELPTLLVRVVRVYSAGPGLWALGCRFARELSDRDVEVISQQ